MLNVHSSHLSRPGCMRAFSDSGGRHSSCVSVIVLQLHAQLGGVVGKARVNMWFRLGLGGGGSVCEYVTWGSRVLRECSVVVYWL